MIILFIESHFYKKSVVTTIKKKQINSNSISFITDLSFNFMGLNNYLAK